MLALKIAPNGTFFSSKLAKKGCFWSKKGDFPGFQFTDEFTGAVGQSVYFVPLILIMAPQKVEF